MPNFLFIKLIPPHDMICCFLIFDVFYKNIDGNNRVIWERKEGQTRSEHFLKENFSFSQKE